MDTHTHILAVQDDGAQTMRETMRLIDKAVEEGLSDIIATPHGYHPAFKTDMCLLFKQLKAVNEYIKKENLPIEIHSGQECRLSEKLLERLKAGKAMTMAESRYVLLELPSTNIPAHTTHIIQQLIEGGYIPIIAHAERNQAIIENPARLRKLLLNGALAQVTAGAVAGSFGKSIQNSAMILIEANLIHIYGSDVHDLSKRPFLFNEGLEYLKKKNLHEIVEILLENNERILGNDDLIILEPQETLKRKWWNVFV